MFSSNGNGWQWKCQVGCGHGDEIAFLVKHFDISRREAINRYLEMAGFPPRRTSESREYPKSLGSLEHPVSHVSPVSEGQTVDGEIDKGLRALAALNACTQLNTARTRRFKLLRDLKCVEKEIGRRLTQRALVLVYPTNTPMNGTVTLRRTL
jgi:hypothetical protein